MRRGHITTNVAELARAPRLEEEDIEPYAIEEIQSLLLGASKLRNSTRWVIALALGLRQGEALGLRWEDVYLYAGYLRTRKNRLRPKYAHGCGEVAGQIGEAPGALSTPQTPTETESETEDHEGPDHDLVGAFVCPGGRVRRIRDSNS
jgi:hypothetical protein